MWMDREKKGSDSKRRTPLKHIKIRRIRVMEYSHAISSMLGLVGTELTFPRAPHTAGGSC